MFIDYVEIFIASGKGGDGAVAFRREKYVPRGGPSGGDGGRGGSVIIRANPASHTLIDFRFKHHFRAADGENGQGGRKTGRDGADLIIQVPPGTVIKTKSDRQVLADLQERDAEITVAAGGKGGWGNARFATPTRQAPKFARPGTPAESRHLILELKLIADVGLVGYPNSGKSTLISVVSNCRPKIADYPFTTLEPNLGLVRIDENRSFVVADIPGLIEGAHQGKGLGDKFLKHIERTGVLVHLIDLAEDNPMERYRKIRAELASYGAGLAEKPEIVVANKIDRPEAQENLSVFRKEMRGANRKVFAVSALQRKGIKELLYAISGLLFTPT